MKNVADLYPLSPVQQGMLFPALLAPEATAYLAPKTGSLHGKLDVSAFKLAWQRAAQHNAVLRTAFLWRGLADPLQVVRETVNLPWKEEDYRELLPEEQEERVEIFLRTDRAEGMDPSRAPLMRLALLRLADDAYQFIWTHHHLLLDGWSSPILFGEVLADYDALRRGEVLHPGEKPPYRDYIAWLERQDLRAAERFWRKELEGFAEPTPLWVERQENGAAAREELYAEASLALSQEETVALQAFAAQHRLTLNTLLQGAWGVLLGHYSKREDVVFGATVSGRPPDLRGVETMIGLFINTLPVRVRTAEEARLLPWLKDLQDRQVQMRQYEYTPVPEVQGWSDVPQGRPLFETIVVYQNYPVTIDLKEPLQGLQVRNLRGISSGNYALVVRARVEPPFTLTTLYDESLFDRSAITRLLDHMRLLLTSMATLPDARLGDLERSVAMAESNEPLLQQKRRKDLKLTSLMNLQARSVKLSGASLVSIDTLREGQPLPRVIQPSVRDIDLIDWATGSRDAIEQELLKHGGILFRNWGLRSVDDFERFARAAMGEELLDYTYRSTPRSQVRGKVYTSTEYPPHQSIPLHNEMAYSRAWPLRIAFHCARSAERGGETPIADSRKVFDRIDPAIRERFAKERVMYVRNYGGRVDLPWQDVFQTCDRAEVEGFCHKAGIELEWMGTGGERLRTRQVCQAVAQHPRTGEMVWFNQAHLFHVSSLPQEVQETLRREFDEADLPRNVYYGDGSPIAPETLAEIREAYDKETIVFPWSEGDILLLDNMLAAHGRTPFVGSRSVVVAMAGTVTNEGN
jgi:alpha-ketoglutarate-dependent taurine dioxygenase